MSFDRNVRKTVFMAMFNTIKISKDVFCSALTEHIRIRMFIANARHFNSCLERSLFSDNIDINLYNILIETVHESLPLFHQYLNIRQHVLKLKELDMYDMYVPLTKYELNIPYEMGVKWVLESLKHLGEEYVKKAKEGLLEQRWADVHCCEESGKGNKWNIQDGISIPCYDKIQHLIINYQNKLSDLFSLTHELGYSMRSYYSAKYQPHRYFEYSIFIR